MTESADADAAAARASEQARLRKERREAKIKAGGSARLNRITGLGGGFQRDPIPTATASGTDATTASPTPAAAAPTADHADPDEVDISSQHFPSPRRQQQQQQPSSEMSEAQLRQLMLGMDVGRGDGSPAPPNPFAANPFLNPGVGGGQPGGPEDPMLRMLQQMMGGQMPGSAGAFPGMPGAAPQQQQQQQPPPLDTYSAAWRILHLVVALGLGLYIALTGSFVGTLEARDAARLASDAGMSSATDLDGQSRDSRARFFYMFATAEAVLLTSRFFLDRTRALPPGILWTVAGFLPPGLKRYLETALRYGQVFTTVRSDLLVCVFVLGVCHWWRTQGGVGV
ncbi:hypothetical protein PpBr36_08044 [Pyricularia pennisetigena]|uniref:hypothetical protein n=1 Tax=Pyricularia pennisetigena TaxID=1578925 RepID=UPI00115186F0|nr:hypothetical protein PpBr36_08044 [Pyricularia pennisetigena]TLS24240.1 hypothetical protein PpBr36_08044 [Pyricularia pennisetigena]